MPSLTSSEQGDTSDDDDGEGDDSDEDYGDEDSDSEDEWASWYKILTKVLSKIINWNLHKFCYPEKIVYRNIIY